MSFELYIKRVKNYESNLSHIRVTSITFPIMYIFILRVNLSQGHSSLDSDCRQTIKSASSFTTR